MVSLELFAHYVGATTNFDAFFDYYYSMRMTARMVGLPDA
jgi:hypothetical protein